MLLAAGVDSSQLVSTLAGTGWLAGAVLLASGVPGVKRAEQHAGSAFRAGS